MLMTLKLINQIFEKLLTNVVQKRLSRLHTVSQPNIQLAMSNWPIPIGYPVLA